MIETCRCKETSWNAKSSTDPERKARTARKKLRVLPLGHPPFSEMMEVTSGRGGTATDRDGDTKIEAGGGIEVVFIRGFAFGRVIDLHPTTKDFRPRGFRHALETMRTHFAPTKSMPRSSLCRSQTAGGKPSPDANRYEPGAQRNRFGAA